MPTIIPKDRADSQRLARALLDAAGDRPERVRTINPRGRLAFVVDDELAAAVGTGDYAPPPEAPKKRAPRKTSAKTTD
ncbi:hypothetical protein ACK8HH_17130 [Gordonia sp. LUNF6]|uniref:hypothetical protein n=1 Tax=unclassified Gordonia (in: high G+C Gram-positive bacteria) TaxID=2657482 RepID=UPI0007830663|nr:hypothetical protein [Gordonia sp. QH-12]KXT55662.1 hypothetical protein Y710_18050 [Gordonia sp. QH-12]